MTVKILREVQKTLMRFYSGIRWEYILSTQLYKYSCLQILHLKKYVIFKTNTSSVADPGFPRGGGANPTRWGGAQTYYLAKFSQKLHENEEILSQRGAHIPRPPRSATAAIIVKSNQNVAVDYNTSISDCIILITSE